MAKDKTDKKGKAYTSKLRQTVKGQQSGKSNFDKLAGVIPAKGTGVDPITNTSYPKKKK